MSKGLRRNAVSKKQAEMHRNTKFHTQQTRAGDLSVSDDIGSSETLLEMTNDSTHEHSAITARSFNQSATTRTPIRPGSRVLHGRFRQLSQTEIEGWAWDPQTPNKRIRLEVVEGENQLLVLVADQHREDLISLGCGDGRHGFKATLDEGLLAEGQHILSLRCMDTGSVLPGSPLTFAVRRAILSAPGAAFRAYIDKITESEILGWIMSPDQPSRRHTVLLKEADQVIAQTVASQFRYDLLKEGVGDGHYAFTFQPPRSMLDGKVHMLEVVEEQTNTHITTTPIRWCPDAETSSISTQLTSAKVAELQLCSNDIVSVIRGVITRLRERMNLGMDTPAPQEVSISLTKLESLPDAEAVFYSYHQIFGGAPDVPSFRTIINGLRRGLFDRREMIERLRHEPNALRVLFINDTLEHGTAAAKDQDADRVFYSATEFDTEDVELFLTLAYRAILKRDPNASDRTNGRRSIIAGASRSEILMSLLNSEESKARAEPTAIFGITPTDQMFGLLFSSITRLSQSIVDHDYKLCLFKKLPEGA